MGGMGFMGMFRHISTYNKAQLEQSFPNPMRSHRIIKITKSTTAEYMTETRIMAKTSA
jgi:hypothetical protein